MHCSIDGFGRLVGVEVVEVEIVGWVGGCEGLGFRGIDCRVVNGGQKRIALSAGANGLGGRERGEGLGWRLIPTRVIAHVAHNNNYSYSD
jgi:hypothetical protein